jgi:TRAP-type C4-dicarboxylate transport system permease small subunit
MGLKRLGGCRPPVGHGITRSTQLLRHALTRLETFLNLLSSTVLFALMFYVTAEVTMRYLLNKPLPGHLELTQLLIAPSVFLALSYVQAHRGHVGLDLLIDRLPARLRHAVESFTLAVALGAFAIITWFSAGNAWLSWEFGDVTPTAYLPTWWSKAAVPAGCALLCIRLALQLVDSIAGIARPERG